MDLHVFGCPEQDLTIFWEMSVSLCLCDKTSVQVLEKQSTKFNETLYLVLFKHKLMYTNFW